MADSTPNTRRPGPLAGLRVLDAAGVWAMPLAAAMLGDLGAEVIKVESTTRIDMRGSEPFHDNEPTDNYFNRSGTFGTLNRGKKSLTINLKTERGIELYKELIAKSDVLIENNRPGVMKRLGLDYPILSKINPKLIHLSNSGYGQTGPWQHYGAIALSLEPTTGVSSLTGYKDGPPLRWNWLTDFPTAMVAVFAVLGAVRHLRQTGEGQWIDLCMYEVGVSLIGPEVMEYTVNGRMPERRGNRHRVFAPQGNYRAAGDDRWVTISARDDQDWAALCTQIGRPELASDARFATVAARREHHDAIDEIITAWTQTRDAHDVMRTLQAAGVPSGAVLDVRDAFNDPQLHARGLWQVVGTEETSPVGPKAYPTGGWKLSRTPVAIQGPAPTLGQHNEEILIGLLGVQADEMSALEATGVIGTRPAQEGYVPSVLSVEERIRDGRWQSHDPDYTQHIADVFKDDAQA
ncbi:MAG: CoA transferase [Dehalococcoidia bacterium]